MRGGIDPAIVVLQGLRGSATDRDQIGLLVSILFMALRREFPEVNSVDAFQEVLDTVTLTRYGEDDGHSPPWFKRIARVLIEELVELGYGEDVGKNDGDPGVYEPVEGNPRRRRRLVNPDDSAPISPGRMAFERGLERTSNDRAGHAAARKKQTLRPKKETAK